MATNNPDSRYGGRDYLWFAVILLLVLMVRIAQG
jgi:hypothetical protein